MTRRKSECRENPAMDDLQCVVNRACLAQLAVLDAIQIEVVRIRAESE